MAAQKKSVQKIDRVGTPSDLQRSEQTYRGILAKKPKSGISRRLTLNRIAQIKKFGSLPSNKRTDFAHSKLQRAKAFINSVHVRSPQFKPNIPTRMAASWQKLDMTLPNGSMVSDVPEQGIQLPSQAPPTGGQMLPPVSTEISPFAQRMRNLTSSGAKAKPARSASKPSSKSRLFSKVDEVKPGHTQAKPPFPIEPNDTGGSVKREPEPSARMSGARSTQETPAEKKHSDRLTGKVKPDSGVKGRKESNPVSPDNDSGVLAVGRESIQRLHRAPEVPQSDRNHLEPTPDTVRRIPDPSSRMQEPEPPQKTENVKETSQAGDVRKSPAVPANDQPDLPVVKKPGLPITSEVKHLIRKTGEPKEEVPPTPVVDDQEKSPRDANLPAVPREQEKRIRNTLSKEPPDRSLLQNQVPAKKGQIQSDRPAEGTTEALDFVYKQSPSKSILSKPKFAPILRRSIESPRVLPIENRIPLNTVQRMAEPDATAIKRETFDPNPPMRSEQTPLAALTEVRTVAVRTEPATRGSTRRLLPKRAALKKRITPRTVLRASARSARGQARQPNPLVVMEKKNFTATGRQQKKSEAPIRRIGNAFMRQHDRVGLHPRAGSEHPAAASKNIVRREPSKDTAGSVLDGLSRIPMASKQDTIGSTPVVQRISVQNQREPSPEQQETFGFEKISPEPDLRAILEAIGSTGRRPFEEEAAAPTSTRKKPEMPVVKAKPSEDLKGTVQREEDPAGPPQDTPPEASAQFDGAAPQTFEWQSEEPEPRPAPDLGTLAKQVFPIIRRMLEVEKERSSGRRF